MAVVTIAHRLDRRWTAAFPAAGDCPRAGIVHRKKITTVHHLSGHAIGTCALRNASVGLRALGEFGVTIVLVHKDHRQLQHHGQIQCLGNRALIRRTITDERHRNRTVTQCLGGERSSRCNRWATPNDGVGAQHALGHIGDVHRPTLTIAQPVLFAGKLQQHRLDFTALGDAVAMTPMRTGNVVIVGHV